MANSHDGATMFLVALPDPAIRIERVLDTIDSSMPGGHAVVTIDNLRVHRRQMLGESGQGFKYAQVRLAPARLTHCMRWLGACTRAQEIASEYAVKRHAFCKPLIEHEGVGFMLAGNRIDSPTPRISTAASAHAQEYATGKSGWPHSGGSRLSAPSSASNDGQWAHTRCWKRS